MDSNETLLRTARRLDRAGKLEQAESQIHGLNAVSTGDAALSRRIESFLAEAEILRHREDPVSVRRARNLAAQALRLSELPAVDASTPVRARAALEFSACALAGDDYEQSLTTARPWADHGDPEIAGRAWALVGETHLATERYADALASLLNAVAEFARAGRDEPRLRARTLVSAALSRSGRASEAAAVLDRDERHWGEPSAGRRFVVEYLVIRAENLQRLGRFSEAIECLRRARRALYPSSGMEAAKVRIHQQRAGCLAEWGQLKEAEREKARASRILAKIAEFPLPAELPRPVPKPAPAVPVTPVTGVDTRTVRGLHHDLMDRGVRLEAELAHVARRRGIRRALAGNRREERGDLADHVRNMIEDARLGGLRKRHAVDFVIRQVERLQAEPEHERAEVRALIEAGAALREAACGALADSERLIRRAQARLDLLAGMGIWRARADVELARTLQCAERYQEALELVVAGVQELDRQRYLMSRRDFRHTWLETEIHPSFELAIELAVACGNDALAADLVVFSRTAGVVVAQAPDQAVGETTDIPLLPVPRLRYIDGATSRLGSDGECLFC